MLHGLNKAMAHIEQHLDEPIDVAELARIATTSEYHVRRLFSALAGLPLSKYVRRRRLTVAGALVLIGILRCSISQSVTDTARARRSPALSGRCTVSVPPKHIRPLRY